MTDLVAVALIIFSFFLIELCTSIKLIFVHNNMIVRESFDSAYGNDIHLFFNTTSNENTRALIIIQSTMYFNARIDTFGLVKQQYLNGCRDKLINNTGLKYCQGSICTYLRCDNIHGEMQHRHIQRLRLASSETTTALYSSLPHFIPRVVAFPLHKDLQISWLSRRPSHSRFQVVIKPVENTHMKPCRPGRNCLAVRQGFLGVWYGAGLPMMLALIFLMILAILVRIRRSMFTPLIALSRSSEHRITPIHAPVIVRDDAMELPPYEMRMQRRARRPRRIVMPVSAASIPVPPPYSEPTQAPSSPPKYADLFKEVGECWLPAPPGDSLAVVASDDEADVNDCRDSPPPYSVTPETCQQVALTGASTAPPVSSVAVQTCLPARDRSCVTPR